MGTNIVGRIYLKSGRFASWAAEPYFLYLGEQVFDVDWEVPYANPARMIDGRR